MSTWRSINEIGSWQGEVVGRRKNNENYAEFLSISTMKNELGEVSYYVGVFSDISERKAAEERVAYVVLHDFLTNLPNGSAITRSFSSGYLPCWPRKSQSGSHVS